MPGRDRSSRADRPAGAASPRFFFRSEELPRWMDLLRERMPQQAEAIIQYAEKICRHRFDLLGYEDLDYGREIDWHLDRVHGKRAPRDLWFKIRYLDFASVGDAKITWELNRHQHLVTLAKAYRLTNDYRFARELADQWEHWQRENPYPRGINWAPAVAAILSGADKQSGRGVVRPRGGDGYEDSVHCTGAAGAGLGLPQALGRR